jgi:serine protease AprX
MPGPAARIGRLWLVAALALASLAPAGPASAAAPRDPALGKVAAWVLANTADGQEAEFLVVLARQADLSGAGQLPTKQAKGRYVYEVLRQAALESQPPLLEWLRAHGAPHRSYYIVNAVWVRGDAALVQALAARDDVARIDGNPRVLNAAAAALVPAAPQPAAAPGSIEPNIAYTGAPEVWDMGFTGQGVVIGGQDTGYAWEHPALRDQYRGWDGSSANHDYNWHDAIHAGGGVCGADSPVPCDDGSHGTHTLGTALGDDGGSNRIGMAPAAQWIGCRNMDEGVGSPATYIECFEFFLAPYPLGGDPLTDGNPDLAPDVTNNSWACPPFEGCEPNSLLQAADAQRAAGIMTVTSAGNSGSQSSVDNPQACFTVHDPPAIYGSVYSVGALATGSDNIASFSSRGPVTVDGSGRPKPNITAPGTNIRSAVPSGYSPPSASGTSMAAPHVAGAVALLWSAVPSLKGHVDLTEEILNESAVPIATTDCDSNGSPNNVYGHGRLDIKAAVELALERYSGRVVGTVWHAENETPMPNVRVFLHHSPAPTYTTRTNAQGEYAIAAPEGSYMLVVFTPHYIPVLVHGIQVAAGETITHDIALQPALLAFLPVVTWGGPGVGTAHGRLVSQKRSE